MKILSFNIFALLTIVSLIKAQEVTLSDCITKAKSNYPLTGAVQHIEEATQTKLKSLQSQYYPQFDLTGQMTWQNDVAHVAASGLPFQMPTAPKDQYKAYVDVRQVIYDGGATSAAKLLEQTKNETDRRSIDVELRQVEAGVIQSYFLILSIDCQLKQLVLTIANLNARLNEVEVKIKNGYALQSQADLFQVEILQLQQRQVSLTQARQSAMAILSEYTGMPLSDEVVLQLPQIVADAMAVRPELSLYQAQIKQLDASQKLTGALHLPRLAAFGQVGYGNPGFNMLLDSFEPFYMVGLRLNWTLWDWQRNRNDRLVIASQQRIIQQRQASFERQQAIQKLDIHSRVSYLEASLRFDDQIIELRERITQTALSQLNSGTLAPADYIGRLNEEAIARLALELHRVELARAIADMNFAAGGNW
jgi:outer membrane protein TolC